MRKRTVAQMRHFADRNASHMTQAEEACLIILYQIRKYLKFKNIDIGQIDKQAIFQSRSHLTNYITDFYIESLKLAIEVDGGYHDRPGQQTYDVQRDKFISQPRKYYPGVKVLRYRNEFVLGDPQAARDQIRKDVLSRIKEKNIEGRLFVTPWQEKAQQKALDNWRFSQAERSYRRGY